MKVLSIMEPWASLISQKIKYIETRSWKTNYRGELYIHASLKSIKKSDEHINSILSLLKDNKLKYGYIIAKCRLVDCVYMDNNFIENLDKNSNEYICGIYSYGRYAWILEDTKKLDNPIFAKGHLGIWNY